MGKYFARIQGGSHGAGLLLHALSIHCEQIPAIS